MKKCFIILFLITGIIACDPINKLYVKYGEVKAKLEQQPNGIIRLYFDRMGTIYPDIRITDEGLVKSGGSLTQLYQNRPAVFSQVLATHHLPAGSSTQKLQEILVKEATYRINNAAAGRKLVFLVHGYNNHPEKPEEDNTVVVYRALRKKIIDRYPGYPIQFVEVYWDGCSKMNGKLKAIRQKLNSLKIWDNAQAASNNVALELRRILSRIENDDNIIITHSLGASVATCALFNAVKFNDNDFMRGIVARYRDPIVYSTPVHRFRVGMLAPAIPGQNTFAEFYDRTPAANNPSNYRFIVGLNTNDEVLKKFIGIPKWFGSTSLGCLVDEMEAVKKQVNTEGRRYIWNTDFSMLDGDQPQKDHSLLIYMNNSRPMNEFLDYLFK